MGLIHPAVEMEKGYSYELSLSIYFPTFTNLSTDITLLRTFELQIFAETNQPIRIQKSGESRGEKPALGALHTYAAHQK